jgi:hypothetical protein
MKILTEITQSEKSRMRDSPGTVHPGFSVRVT